MPGPWEQYAQQDQEPKPWETYGKLGEIPDAAIQQPSPVAPEQPIAPPVTPEVMPGEKGAAPSDLPEIGNAPELNELSFGALKTSFGLLTTGKDKEARSIIKKNIPEASFREGPEGGTLVDLPSGSYWLNKPGLSGQDIIKGIFDIAAFTPAGRAATIPKAIAGAAATEAVMEAGEAAVGGEFDVRDVGEAAALGGAGKALEKGVSAIARGVKGAPSVMTQEVVRAGEKYNVPVLTTDVVEPKTFFGRFIQATTEKIPVAGTGGIRAAQQEARQGAIRSFSTDYGFTPRPDVIVASMKSKKAKLKALAGERYEGLVNQMDSSGVIPLTKTYKAIDGAIERLSRKGVVKNKDAIADLNMLKNTLEESPQSFSMMRENRTNFRDVINATDSSQRSQMPSFAKKKLEDILSAMTNDMDDFVKDVAPNKLSSYKKADQIYRREAIELTKSRLKGVLDKGDITPEQVNLMLFSNKPSENKLLYKSLTTEGRQAARSGLIAKALSDAGGIDDISPEKFLSTIKRNKDQFNVFFRSNDKKQLNGLTKLLSATKRAPQAALAPPTGVQAVGLAGLGGAIMDLGSTLVAGGTAGTLAKAYESPIVRDFLVKVANTPKGTVKFDRLIQQVSPFLISGMQAAREQTKSE